jgi:arabinofuranan 3-O-arabinosyltransferase
MSGFLQPFIQSNAHFPMRQKAFDPLFCVAVAATFVAGAYIVLVSIEPSAPTLLWTDKDFANYWLAAHLAFEGRGLDVFGPNDTYLAHLRAIFGLDYPWRAWSYPPHYLLLMLPLDLVPYKIALILFLLVTFLLLCAAIRLTSRHAADWQLLLLLPAVATNGMSVQNGYLISALLLAGLALREKRPVLAGICFGLLTVKPQLGVLLPLLLLREGQWRTIASACVTGLALFLLSVAVFGIEAWSGYFNNVVPYQTLVMKVLAGLFPHMMPTVFGSARSLGFDAAIAFAAHLPFATAVLALYSLSLFRLDRPETRAASTLFATTLAVPYLVNYDLIALVACAVLLSGPRQETLQWRCAIIPLAFIPMLTPLLGLCGWPVAPVIILASWLALLHQEGVFSRVKPFPSPATP